MNEATPTMPMAAAEVLTPGKSMNDAIVSAVGKLWKHLDDNGASTFFELRRQTGLSTEMVNRAIGWLAREDKLCFETTNRSEQIRLRQ